MRALPIILIITCFGTLPCSAQDTTSNSVAVHFKVPKDWKRLNDSTFVLKDFGKEFNEWSQYLADGHMPWRLGPKNVAVACLWDFGIEDPEHTLVWEFASYLKEITTGQEYMLTVGFKEYIIFVRSKLYESHFKDGKGRERTDEYHIPIPYRFEIRHATKNGG